MNKNKISLDNGEIIFALFVLAFIIGIIIVSIVIINQQYINHKPKNENVCWFTYNDRYIVVSENDSQEMKDACKNAVVYLAFKDVCKEQINLTKCFQEKQKLNQAGD